MVSNTVSSAKDTMATHVTGAVDVTRDAVQSGVDMTKLVVSSGVHSVMDSRVGQMVLSSVDSVLGKSEAWADNNLPMTDAELGEYSPRASVSSSGLLTWARVAFRVCHVLSSHSCRLSCSPHLAHLGQWSPHHPHILSSHSHQGAPVSSMRSLPPLPTALHGSHLPQAQSPSPPCSPQGPA
jgi:hypothetical protein